MVSSLLLSNPTATTTTTTTTTTTNLSSPLLLSHKLKYQQENTKKGISFYTPILRSPRIIIKCAVDAPFEGNIPKFPLMNAWDPYKRLGISPYASEEEIRSSRNFLLQQYAGHERSEESIEASFERLLMISFRQRKKQKLI